MKSAVRILTIGFGILSISAILLISFTDLLFSKNTKLINNNPKTLTFAALGDFDSTEYTKKVLKNLKNNGTDFTLALGDLSYGTKTENAWCKMVTSHMGEKYPFELVAGNHDVELKDHPKNQGHIDRFSQCLPNRISSMQGDYGKEYYFDYGKLLRVIAIAPNLTINEKQYEYVKGTESYEWLEKLLMDSKDQKIEWTVVAMHKNCITFGVHKCEIGKDLMNLLLEKKVNLILQGHEHAYMRSKQLGLSEDCPEIKEAEFNPKCIKDSSTSNYNKAIGSILVINGTGGTEVRDVDFSRPESQYFSDWHSANVDPSYGPTIVNVEPKSMQVTFQDISGSVKDSFTINK